MAKTALKPDAPAEPARKSPSHHRAALTISRPEILIDGSDRQFRSLVHNLFAFFARHSAVREGHGAFIGLAGIEYTALISIRHLSTQDDIGVRDLAAHLHMSGAFTTTVTNKLLAKGLIRKAAHAVDRRRVSLSVTPRGHELLDRLAPIQMQVNDIQFGCLSAAEFRLLLDMVERLVKSSEQAVALQRYLAGSEAEIESPQKERDDETRGPPPSQLLRS